MISANISTIKSRLSSYLDQVKGGEIVIISDRTNPVAVLSPYRPQEGVGQWGPRLTELVRKGMAVSRGKRDKAFKINPRNLDKEARLVEAVLQERADGR